jgi:hypothetical protein
LIEQMRDFHARRVKITHHREAIPREMGVFEGKSDLAWAMLLCQIAISMQG